jgi:hypothetical protein
VKKQLILGLLVIVAFIFFQHKSVPSLPMPTQFQTVGKSIQVPVIMKITNPNGEHWVLTRRSNDEYTVNAYNGYRLVQAYPAGQQIPTDASGTTFKTSGKILLNGSSYVAAQIHVNPSGKSGYILFQPA